MRFVAIRHSFRLFSGGSRWCAIRDRKVKARAWLWGGAGGAEAEELEIPLDAHAWAGLAYLESASGPGAIAELVEGFTRDVPIRLERMQAALLRGDLRELERLAHDLKSNAATLGVLELSAQAAWIERSARDAEPIDFAGLLETCRLQVPTVLRALQRRIPSI